MPTSAPSRILNVVVDQRFKRTPDGQVWTHTPPSYEFFEGPLLQFDRVRIIGRTIDTDTLPDKAKLVNGPNVEVVAIPNFVGPFQYIRRRSEILGALKRVAALDGAFLLRIPSKTGFELASMLEAVGKVYAIELLTDPYEFFAPGVSPNGLAHLFRPYFCNRSRELCASAVAVNYITGSATRRANQAVHAKWVGSVSDVDLAPQAFVLPLSDPTVSPIEIVTVGFLDLLYKGQDILVRALSKCYAEGLDFRLTLVGDGQSRSHLLDLAQSCGIGDRVSVTGALGGAESVREVLRRAHLFTLPSRAEGIPRALLEAMAAGLPAICSKVGAMPDLLDPEWIIPPASISALSAKILEFSRMREHWTAIGLRNQTVARQFGRDQLEPRRLDFYKAIARFGSNSARKRLVSLEVPDAA